MFQTNNPCPAVPAGNIKKTMMALSLAIGLGSVVAQSQAALPSDTTLDFADGVVACNAGVGTPPSDCPYGTNVPTGSYFGMDISGDGDIQNAEKIAIDKNDGLKLGVVQPASGSHGGPPDGSETPGIDMPWFFGGNTGMSLTTSSVDVTSEDGLIQELDFTGWAVTWNGIPLIPMGGCSLVPGGCDINGDGNDDNVNTGLATLKCGTDCSNGDTFELDYSANVPVGDASGFGGVGYGLHLEGTISLPGATPIAGDDSAQTIVGNTINISVLDKVTSATPITPDSIGIPSSASNGTATGKPDNTIDYAPNTAPDFTGMDSFDYTVDNAFGTSNPGTVTVDVQNNVAPVANNDQAATNTVAFDNASGKLNIDVLKNDTDVNNDPGLPGGLDATTVNVLTQPTIGSCAANTTTGEATYSQTPPTVAVSTSCTYEVMDIDSFGTPLTSNVATIAIDITSLSSDWPPALDPDIIPFLVFEDGVPNKANDTSRLPESGTYFSMDVSAATTIYTTLVKGTDGALIIGYDQISGNSHTGNPTGNEITTIDLGWSFFGNTGMTFTKNGGIVGNTDGTLEFAGTPSVNGGQGRYQITWNGIPEIDLGGSDQFPQDLGFGLITCNPAPCADGSTFDLNYEAHVPPGDPSGFGGVQYKLIMNGDVLFLDGSFQTSSGTFSVEDRLTAGEVEPDPDSEIQCAGGCFDYTVTGVAGPTVSVVLPLNGAVPAPTPDGVPQMRVFRDGVWSSFNTIGNNSVLSAPFTSGGDFGTVCPPPGDAAYGDLTAGHQCLQVTIEDNGPNDKDSAVGTITDPSGLGIPTVVPPPDNRKSGTSGCTVTSAPISPLQGGSWWLLTGLIAWIGWSRRKSKQH